MYKEDLVLNNLQWLVGFYGISISYEENFGIK